MPKTNLCKPTKNPCEAELIGALKGGMAREEISMKELAKKTGIPYSTLNKRLNEDIRSLTFGEYWDMNKHIHTRAYEKVRFV